MSRESGFSALRQELDRAITYGTRTQAMALARRCLRRAQASGAGAETEYFLGQIELLKERFVTAIEHFDACIRLHPADGAAYNDRALCMVEIGILDNALEYFDKGICVEPDYATIHHNKGWLLNHLGCYRQAIACFKKALELEPDRAVTYDNLADALASLGDFAGALEAYRTVLRLLRPGQCRAIRRQITFQIKELERRVSARQ